MSKFDRLSSYIRESIYTPWIKENKQAIISTFEKITDSTVPARKIPLPPIVVLDIPQLLGKQKARVEKQGYEWKPPDKIPTGAVIDNKIHFNYLSPLRYSVPEVQWDIIAEPPGFPTTVGHEYFHILVNEYGPALPYEEEEKNAAVFGDEMGDDVAGYINSDELRSMCLRSMTREPYHMTKKFRYEEVKIRNLSGKLWQQEKYKRVVH